MHLNSSFLLSKGEEVALIEGPCPVKAVLWVLLPGDASGPPCFHGLRRGKFVASQHPVRPSL